MVGLEGLDLGRRCPSIVATQSLLAVGKKRHFGASLGDVSATGPARAFRATLGAGALPERPDGTKGSGDGGCEGRRGICACLR